jgi:dTDP-4-amino-4,6-dideoxygalactose transaminase
LYRSIFAELSVPVRTPQPTSYQTRHIYNQFVVCGERRDELQAHLKDHGIGCEVYYPLPLHLQRCYAFLGHQTGDYPVSEKLATESLALPIQSELASDDVEHVCRTIQRFYQ